MTIQTPQRKTCTKCKVEKEIEKFARRSGKNRHLRQSWCHSCTNKSASGAPSRSPAAQRRYAARHRADNPDSVRDYRLRSKYGITLEQYNEMLARQSGGCAICSTLPSIIHAGETVSSLSVDHDHTTGRVRGLLCHPCNMAIGLFKDNVDRLRSAAAYLED